MLISTLMCNVVNLGLGYYLVNRTTWGWMGAAVSHAVGEFTKVPTVLLCMVIGLGDSGECEDTTDYSTTGNPQDTQHYLEVDSGADDPRIIVERLLRQKRRQNTEGSAHEHERDRDDEGGSVGAEISPELVGALQEHLLVVATSLHTIVVT